VKRIIIATAACCALLQLVVSVAFAVVVPQGFVVEDAYPDVAFNRPTTFAFTPDGRLLVAEKRGVVRVVQNGVKLSEPMWSAEDEVLNFGDRGLIGLTLDPDFAVNR